MLYAAKSTLFCKTGESAGFSKQDGDTAAEIPKTVVF